MDTTFLPTTLSLWLMQYGEFSLFILLALGIFALPIPDETLMLLAGVLMAHDKLSPFPTYMAAIFGAITGISISYYIGRIAGRLVVRRYGHWVGITEPRMRVVHNWFERFGRFALLIGYFIPGVRHLTGYAAGITTMQYKHFAVFAYTGAVIWACIFLSLGYFVGDRWENIEALFIKHWEYFVIVGAALSIAGIVWVLWRKKKIRK